MNIFAFTNLSTSDNLMGDLRESMKKGIEVFMQTETGQEQVSRILTLKPKAELTEEGSTENQSKTEMGCKQSPSPSDSYDDHGNISDRLSDIQDQTSLADSYEERDDNEDEDADYDGEEDMVLNEDGNDEEERVVLGEDDSDGENIVLSEDDNDDDNDGDYITITRMNKKRRKQINRSAAPSNVVNNDNFTLKDVILELRSVKEGVAEMKEEIAQVKEEMAKGFKLVNKRIAVSQEISLAAWIASIHKPKNLSSMYQSKKFLNQPNNRSMFNRIQKEYLPTYTKNVNKIPLQEPLKSELLEKLKKQCSPNTSSIEYNIHGACKEGVIIAEATMVKLLTRSEKNLTDTGWFKLFQLERQIAAMHNQNLFKVILFSMDQSEFFMTSVVKKVLSSFPLLNEMMETDRLEHVYWTEQMS